MERGEMPSLGGGKGIRLNNERLRAEYREPANDENERLT